MSRVRKPERAGSWGLVSILALLVSLALPAVATAVDFCVDNAPICPAGHTDVGDIQAGLDAAEPNGTADRVFVPAGTFVAPVGGFAISSNEPIELIGSGQDPSGTIIEPLDSTNRALDIVGSSPSFIDGLRVSFPRTTTPEEYCSCRESPQTQPSRTSP